MLLSLSTGFSIRVVYNNVLLIIHIPINIIDAYYYTIPYAWKEH